MIKRVILVLALLLLGFSQLSSYAQEGKIILLIAEQNIEGPQRAWWASEIDLSATEATIAQALITRDYKVIEPGDLNKVIQKERAFRVIAISESQSVKLGSLSRADYVIQGKAIASAGGNVPQSQMRSCFANITAKLIRVKDGKVIAYLESSGNSAHTDVITGGREALARAAGSLAEKIIAELVKAKEGGK
jgi:hypothetical protein